MCENCGKIHVNKNTFILNEGYDPTRTTGLRNAFAKELNKRFNQITSLIKVAIIEEDVLGLNDKITANVETPGPKAFQFHNSSQKVEAFMNWLNGQVDKKLLETTSINQLGTGVNAAWSNIYIADSYKRGVQRARYELKKAGYSVPTIEQTGGIDVTMSTPFHADRLGILYTRTYNELKGITRGMDTQISRILTQGIADGDNPRVLAKKLVDAIDGSGKDTLGRPTMSPRRRAEILARTEIVNAHHKATIQEYRNWGVAGVSVQAEFQTAGDDRVCSVCASLSGKIFTLDEIENLIPVHPQCRCIALPTLPDEAVEENVKQEVISTPPESTYDWAIENGWTSRISKKDVDFVFNKKFKGFNLPELDNEMNAHANEYGFSWDSKKIKGGTKSLEVQYEGWWNDELIKITRTFKPDLKTVEHSFFQLPDDLQGQGFAKKVLKSYYTQYKKSGVAQIDIYANIDVGGYAWGKYGFYGDVEDIDGIIFKYERNSGEFASEAREIFEQWYEVNENTPYFPVHLLADTEFGKDLLLGKNWNGILDLKDKQQVARFEDYLNKSKK